MSYTAQEVAAAILYLHGERMDYIPLTRLVLETKLSGLGTRGGVTPERTLNRELNQRYQGKKIFHSRYYGKYELEEPDQVKNFPKIARAIEKVRELRLRAMVDKIQRHLEKLPEQPPSIYNINAFEQYNDLLEKGIHTIYLDITGISRKRPLPPEEREYKHRYSKP